MGIVTQKCTWMTGTNSKQQPSKSKQGCERRGQSFLVSFWVFMRMDGSVAEVMGGALIGNVAMAEDPASMKMVRLCGG